MTMTLLQRTAGIAVFLLCLVVSASGAYAAAYADFRADVQFQREGKTVRTCGSAMSSGPFARMDIDFDKAGRFSFIVDTREHMLRVLSHSLKAYVEIPVSGDPRNWRTLVKSAAAAVMPQSMGMISLQEKETVSLGRDNWQGYSVQKFRSVFEAGFMGSIHRFTLEVWENEAFAPFPLYASSAETSATHAGSAWLSNIAAEQSSQTMFRIPDSFTRYASVMDLFLYALTAF